MNIEHPEQKNTQSIGKIMIFIMWFLLLGGLAWFFNHWLDKRHNPNQQPQSSIKNGVKTVVLNRNPYGHYVSNGKINGQEVQFFLDTGATNVSIPIAIAEKLSLAKGPQFQVNTANGIITVYATTIDTIELGDIKLHDIRASINPYMEDMDILLGMSFLKQLEFTQKDKQLTLRQ